MKTLTTSLILSVMFLSAGAFAGASHNVPVSIVAEPANVTVIEKNQAWPLPGRISVDRCTYNRCIDV
jgi:hypothetical protein